MGNMPTMNNGQIDTAFEKIVNVRVALTLVSYLSDSERMELDLYLDESAGADGVGWILRKHPELTETAAVEIKRVLDEFQASIGA